MTFDVSLYEKLALVTENKSVGEISERLSMASDTLFNHVNTFIQAANLLDADKKRIFYGKNFSAHHEKKTHELLDDPAIIRLLHAIIGIATESGELFEALVAYTNGDMRHEDFLVNLREESGDIEWYQSLLHDVIGTDSVTVRSHNLEKLLVKRYGTSFSEKAAIERNLSAELEVLKNESNTFAEIEYTQDAIIFDNATDNFLSLVAQTDKHVIFSTCNLETGKETIYTLEIKDGKLLSPYIVSNDKVIARYSLKHS